MGSDPASYRLLTMISSDVKVLCKLLSNWRCMAMSCLVHAGQSSFIPGNSMTMNLQRLVHVLHEVEGSREEMTLASTNIEKAFDASGCDTSYEVPPTVSGLERTALYWSVCRVQLGQ
ncbi:hypothetical protein NDU88_008366 [Pleurodeles waltl]|uniref:Uncharacterized protein n=1 Tax=Pleurodeles waltl TaxID=8319 RepID=A0AAV7PU62_PLEWA|nr:hypothetical protein NDU88_008366 [Pleurodeles waltl]